MSNTDTLPSEHESTTELTTERSPDRSGFVAGIVFVLTGLVGAFASFSLLYEKVQIWMNPDHVTACDISPWVSCGLVMDSWQAATFGFPNIFIGVVAFPLLILTGIALLIAGKKLATSRLWWTGIGIGAAFALGFVTWLWYSAVFTIGVLCPYCMVVWAAVIPFAFFTFNYIVSTDVFNVGFPERLKSFASSWWWVLVVLTYLAVIVSIVIMFPYAFTS